MEEQTTFENQPPQDNTGLPSFITPEMVENMKQRAREEAIRITMEQKQQIQQTPPASQMIAPMPIAPPSSFIPNQPQLVYVRRNLTVAELLLVLLLSCGLVVGAQEIWKFTAQILPRIEIKVK
jgi:hypothetical protein